MKTEKHFFLDLNSISIEEINKIFCASIGAATDLNGGTSKASANAKRNLSLNGGLNVRAANYCSVGSYFSGEISNLNLILAAAINVYSAETNIIVIERIVANRTSMSALAAANPKTFIIANFGV